MNTKLFKFSMLLVMTVILAFGFSNTETEKKTDVYLLSAVGKTSDTIGTASTNDTGRVFKNPFEGDLQVSLIQNSVTTTFIVPNVEAGSVRVRYLAADSTLCFERYEDIGWVRLPILRTGADQMITYQAWTAYLRTGSAFYSIKRRT